MFGIALLLIVVGLAALVAVHHVMSVPCEIQERWWRITPPGVKPLATGTAPALFMVVRKARQLGGRSFNYNYDTNRYEIFSQWLVNWTQPVDAIEADGVPKPHKKVTHVTGTVADGKTLASPAPCCEKIKCEMRAHGLFPDGQSLRNWADANPSSPTDTHYYKVKEAAAAWPIVDGSAKPPAKVSKAASLVDTALEDRMKKSGKAIVGHNADGSIALAGDVDTCTHSSCDFCKSVGPDGKCTNPTAEFWYGCNSKGQLYANKAKTSVYTVASR